MKSSKKIKMKQGSKELLKIQRANLDNNRNPEKATLTRVLGIIAPYVGTKIGEITILGLGPKVKGHYHWRGVCSCGVEVSVRGTSLLAGDTTRCKKCAKTKQRGDFIGKRYGMLTIIAATDKTYKGQKEGTKQNRAIWRFRCDCGNEFDEVRNWIRNRINAHCGCQDVGPTVASALHTMFLQYKRGAHDREYPFKLTEKQFESLVGRPCYYCKRPPQARKTQYIAYFASGIDRVDNIRGYELDNCVPCCSDCNRMKGTMSHSAFMDQIDKISNRSCGDDYNTRTTYVTEANVGDTSKVLLLCIYDLCMKFNLQKAEIMVLFKCLLDEHIDEVDELEESK